MISCPSRGDGGVHDPGGRIRSRVTFGPSGKRRPFVAWVVNPLCGSDAFSGRPIPGSTTFSGIRLFHTCMEEKPRCLPTHRYRSRDLSVSHELLVSSGRSSECALAPTMVPRRRPLRVSDRVLVVGRVDRSVVPPTRWFRLPRRRERRGYWWPALVRTARLISLPVRGPSRWALITAVVPTAAMTGEERLGTLVPGTA